MPPRLSTDRGLPRRVDSLHSFKGPYFSDVDEELRDIKRVHTQGQEEDLRLALSRMMSRVEELTSMLKEAFKAQTDLQTELTLAKSNLQLALANNEMLEDALRRDGGVHKDIGWRRWSERERKEREAEEDRRRSSDSAASSAAALNSPVPQPSPMPPLPSSPPPSTTAVPSPAPAPSSEGRFFKFRIGSSSAVNKQFPAPSPRLASTSVSGTKSPMVNGQVLASHLTSASLPSLVPARDWGKEIEELTAELKKERDAKKSVTAQKDALEAELESLSQALFEEANKMVSTERRKLAETEDELKELQAEREALRNALRLLERQSRAAGNELSSIEEGVVSGHAYTLSESSARAIKSPPPSRPLSPSSQPLSPSSGDDGLSSANTVVASQAHRPPPLAILDPDADELSASPMPNEDLQEHVTSDSSQAALQDKESPAESAQPSPSPPPSPSLRSPEIGEYVYPLMRRLPMELLAGEASPWADAVSSSKA